jgi:hypothetical protein
LSYFAAFVASFILIFLKATQQRQVQFAEYRKMPPVSIGMAFCEVFIVANVARTADGFWPLVLLAICIGTGAACGSMLGTYFHVRKHTRRS